MANTSIKSIEEKINFIENQSKKKTTVVAYGIMNAGKSSLLNMLTQHVSAEFFKTNDVRETSEIKKFETEKYIYLDTPGLDANNADDIHAHSGVSQADIVLFLHQPQGALEASEIKFLENLKKSFGTHTESNIVIVITKTDKEDQSKIDLIEKEIGNQCKAKVGVTPKIFQISNKRYQLGKTNHKDALIERSHIQSLKTHIDLIASNTRKVRIERCLNEIEASLNIITNREQVLLNKKEQIHNDINQVFSLLDTKINDLQEFLIDSANKYQKI